MLFRKQRSLRALGRLVKDWQPPNYQRTVTVAFVYLKADQTVAASYIDVSETRFPGENNGYSWKIVSEPFQITFISYRLNTFLGVKITNLY